MKQTQNNWIPINCDMKGYGFSETKEDKGIAEYQVEIIQRNKCCPTEDNA